MADKKLQLQVIDPTGQVVVTHHFYYHAGALNTLRLTVDKQEYVLDNEGHIKEFVKPNCEPKRVGDMVYTNPETGKTQRLFDVLTPVYTVRYINPTCGDKGEALYMTVAAETPEKAIKWAMSKKEFVNHITMKYYSEKYFEVYPATGNYVIGKILYYEGDPRL
jgi:hypothetical protein